MARRPRIYFWTAKQGFQWFGWSSNCSTVIWHCSSRLSKDLWVSEARTPIALLFGPCNKRYFLCRITLNVQLQYGIILLLWLANHLFSSESCWYQHCSQLPTLKEVLTSKIVHCRLGKFTVNFWNFFCRALRVPNFSLSLFFIHRKTSVRNWSIRCSQYGILLRITDTYVWNNYVCAYVVRQYQFLRFVKRSIDVCGITES